MDGYLKIKTKIDNSGFNAQIKATEKKLNDLKSTLEIHNSGAFKLTENEVVDLNKEIEKTTNQLNKLKDKQSQLDAKNFNNMKDSIDNIGGSITKTIKKMGTWALAVFGVRSAYNAVRNAASTLSQYNEQIGVDLEYIRFAMANALQPVVEKLISLAFTLLSYINMIAKAWFGVDLFAKSSAKSMQKAGKSAKEMTKNLSQFNFDDINKLDDSNSTDSNYSSGIPSFDLSAPEDVPVPGWLQWILDNKDLVTAGLLGIAAGIIAIKLGLEGVQALGIGVIVAEIVMLIQDIIKFIKDPSWQGFFNILGDIAIIIGGIMLLMGNWWGLLVIFIGGIVKLVAENWDTIKSVLGTIDKWVLDNVLTPALNFIKASGDTILSIVLLVISILAGILSTVTALITNPFIIAKDTILGVFNGVLTFFRGFVQVVKSLFNGDIKGVLNGFKTMFAGIMDSLWAIAKAPLNLIIGGLNALIKGANKISFDVPDWVPGLGGKKFGFNIPEIKKLATGGIIDVPGRGVPLASNVVGGEAGAEGVLPLTNEETMARLGQEIGKWITLNVDLTGKIDMRVLFREFIKYQNEQSFARNGA